MLTGPRRVKACPVRPERRHAVEHVDPARHPADKVGRLADPHQVARPSARISGVVTSRSRTSPAALADGQPADGVAFEIDGLERGDRFGAKIGKDGPLNDAELAVALARDKGPRERRAQRIDRRMDSAACSSVAGNGVHSSKAMVMVASRRCWISVSAPESAGGATRRDAT